jgi:hypothetical protein
MVGSAARLAVGLASAVAFLAGYVALWRLAGRDEETAEHRDRARSAGPVVVNGRGPGPIRPPT